MTNSSQVTLSSPTLSWRNGLPIANHFDDPYFSADDGLAETRYVFLQHNGLPERWHNAAWDKVHTFNIIETGFGTGLNFLATWQAWQQFQQQAQPAAENSGWLHFTSIEKYPLTHANIEQALACWPELAEFSQQLLAKYPLPLHGAHHLVWPQARLSLTLWFGDIADVLPQINAPVQAWYLDGFAPARNPQMWSEALFQHMRRLSSCTQHTHETTTVATFTAAGVVKRGLQGAGFSLKKAKGFGRKRDMLCGRFMQTQGPELPSYHWHLPWLARTASSGANADAASKQVIVVGAGLAGSCSARALAERGFQVRVFDPKGIANEASGNRQGGLYIKLNAGEPNLHSSFYLQAYQYALRYLPEILGPATASNSAWQQCGLLQLAYSPQERKRQQKHLETPLPSQIITPVDAKQASELAGCTLETGGLFFPQAGWVAPQALCEALLGHPNIQFQQQKITHFEALNSAESPAAQWQVHTEQGQYITTHLVLANAAAVQELLPNEVLPLKRIRGQMTHLSATQAPPLRTVLSGRCYLSPALNNSLCLGATFDHKNLTEEMLASDHAQNLANLQDFGPQWQSYGQRHENHADIIEGGRVGFRCTTPDYLPLVGRLPLQEEFTQRFAQLQKNSKAIAKVECPQHPNLWLNIAHGAKGLVSTPISAEILACAISEAAAPISQELQAALWPGRFLVRDIVRGQHTG